MYPNKQIMSGQILNYFGKSHTGYLHARGKLATTKLIELINPQKEEKILEIGFGTGATMVEMVAESGAHLFGFEISPTMYQKALERIQFCKTLSNINIILLKQKNQFPTPDNTFDKVYAESIIAIQEGEDFKELLLEIQRVLKPKGVLVFNETIWLETTDKEDAKRLNNRCKESFGIIQSNHDYLHASNWKELLSELGFKYEFEMPVSEISVSRRTKRLTMPVVLSKIFSFWGKLKSYALPSLRRVWRNYELEMASIMAENKKLMEGRIIKVYNNKKNNE